MTTQKYLHLNAADLLSATNRTSAIFEAAMHITLRTPLPMDLPLLLDVVNSESAAMAVAA